MTLFEFQFQQLQRAADSVAGSLTGVKAKLCQANIAIDEHTTLATLDAGEATFAGYVVLTPTWDAPSVAADGTVEVVSDLLVFRPTDSVTPNTIFILYIVDTADNHLLYAAQFDNPPLPMGSALDQIAVVLRFRPASDFLVSVVT